MAASIARTKARRRFKSEAPARIDALTSNWRQRAAPAKLSDIDAVAACCARGVVAAASKSAHEDQSPDHDGQHSAAPSMGWLRMHCFARATHTLFERHTDSNA